MTRASTGDILVRDAVAADGPAMGRIHVAAWRSSYASVMDPAFLANMDADRVGANWTRRLTPAASGEEAAEGVDLTIAQLVAERRGKVVAMATVGLARDEDAPAPAQLWMLNCLPEAFGTGTAVKLHEAALQRLLDAGYREAYLWVAHHNPRARRFYEREGWRPDGSEQTEHVGGADVTESRYVREL